MIDIMVLYALYALERVGFNEISFQNGQHHVTRNATRRINRYRLVHLTRGLVVHDRLLTGRAGINILEGEIVQEQTTIRFNSQRKL